MVFNPPIVLATLVLLKKNFFFIYLFIYLFFYCSQKLGHLTPYTQRISEVHVSMGKFSLDMLNASELQRTLILTTARGTIPLTPPRGFGMFDFIIFIFLVDIYKSELCRNMFTKIFLSLNKRLLSSLNGHNKIIFCCKFCSTPSPPRDFAPPLPLFPWTL